LLLNESLVAKRRETSGKLPKRYALEKVRDGGEAREVYIQNGISRGKGKGKG